MRAIYKPKGKAGEYAEYACNFFTGCSNDCQYCYLKRGVLSHIWSTTPTLKKAFKDVIDAQTTFMKELDTNLEELKEKGLFFTFSSDPFLKETKELNLWAIQKANTMGIPVTVLTKRAECINYLTPLVLKRDLVAVGFTLTGHDELEANASTNKERISAMELLHEVGFKTWASIEPIITPESSFRMMNETKDFCDLYKVGLRSGVSKDYYNDNELFALLHDVMQYIKNPVYIKDSLVERLDISPNQVRPFVGKDFNIFSL